MSTFLAADCTHHIHSCLCERERDERESYPTSVIICEEISLLMFHTS